jgi:aryl sulfotransferase
MVIEQQWPEKTRELQTAILDSTRWNGFRFRDDDIIIVTWGKSGTTWMRQIAGQVVFDAPEGLCEAVWLDGRMGPLDGIIAALEAQRQRRILWTHLPLDATVFSSKAKYIYVGRDARDVVWSAHNHHARFTPEALALFNETPGRVGPPISHPPLEIREYYRYFLEHGEMPGLPMSHFWSHVQGWWDVATLPNILFVHFNSLRADLEGQARRVARFLEIEVNDDKWPAILKHCSFEYMQEEAAKIEMLDRIFSGGGRSFIYKGTSGRWKDVLSDQEIKRCDELAQTALTSECAHWLKTGGLPE